MIRRKQEMGKCRFQNFWEAKDYNPFFPAGPAAPREPIFEQGRCQIPEPFFTHNICPLYAA